MASDQDNTHSCQHPGLHCFMCLDFFFFQHRCGKYFFMAQWFLNNPCDLFDEALAEYCL